MNQFDRNGLKYLCQREQERREWWRAVWLGVKWTAILVLAATCCIWWKKL